MDYVEDLFYQRGPSLDRHASVVSGYWSCNDDHLTPSRYWPASDDLLASSGYWLGEDANVGLPEHWQAGDSNLGFSGGRVEEIHDGETQCQWRTSNEDNVQPLAQYTDSRPTFAHDDAPMQVLTNHMDLRRNHLWPLVAESDTVRAQHFEVILPKLRALLPAAQYRRETSVPELSTDDLPFSRSYFCLLVVSLVNGFAGLAGFPVAKVLIYLHSRFTGDQLLSFIESMGKHAATTFAKSLLQCAVQASQPRIVEFLLSQPQFMLHVNCYAIFENGKPDRLINYAISRWDVAVTKILLNHGAFVRQGYHGNEPLSVLATSHFHCFKSGDEAHFFEIGELLLQAGAHPAEVLANVKQSKFTEKLCAFCELVVNKHAKSWYRIWVSSGTVRDLVYRLDSETSSRMIKKLIEAGARFSRDVDLPSRSYMNLGNLPTTTIDAAAKTGNFTLFRVLQEYGAECTTITLVCAVQSGNTDLVRVLCHGSILSVSADELKRYEQILAAEMAIGIHESNGEMRSLLQKNRNTAQDYHSQLRYALLLDAVRDSDVEQLKEQLRAQACVEIPDVDFLSNIHIGEKILQDALVKALTLQHDEIALILFEAGADVDGFSKSTQMALERSLSRKNKSLAKRLIAAASPRRAFVIEYLPLAMGWGDIDIVLDLIHASYYGGIDNPSLTVQSIAQALERAVVARDTAMIAILSEALIHAAEGVLEFPWPLSPVSEKRDHAMVQLLLDLGPNLHFSWPLLEAIDHNVTRLFNFVCENNKKYLARGKKLKDIVLQHLIYRADIRRLTHFLELLENSGYIQSSPNGSDRIPFQLEFDTPLATAINAPKPLRLEATATLLEHGFDPNAIISSVCFTHSYYSETRHITPLLQAIRNDDSEMVEMLIKFGANINCAATRDIPFTPIQQATKQGNFEITQLLLRNGADADSAPGDRNSEGTTALQLAAIGGYVGILELLVDYGANVEAPGSAKKGTTVLGAAAKHGRLDAVRLLLQRGVRLKRQLFGNECVEIRLAKQHGHHAIADLLKSHQYGPSAHDVDNVLECEWQPALVAHIPRNLVTDALVITGAEEEDFNVDPASGYACSHCEKELSSASSLRRHIRSKHSDHSPFTCDNCCHTFKRRDMLRRHIMTTHSNTGKVPCSTCGKAFRRDYFHSTHLTADGRCKDWRANRTRNA